jgi:hypothetical protein
MEQRRTRRFKLELPLSITRAGAERVALVGLTKNISSCGVLFTTGREPDLGGPIEYIITLASDGPQPVNLRCVGKVLRTERTRASADQERRAFQIAATLERYEFVRDRDVTSNASSQTATRARLSD